MFKNIHLWLVGLSFLALPVLADVSNLSTLILEKGFDSSKSFVMGYISGTFSLANIAAIDSQNRPCLGYGSANGDHLLILKNDFPKLKLSVQSEEHGTTLLIKNNKTKTVICGFGENNHKDAEIQSDNWTSGEYEVWVGSIEPGRKIAYRLSAQSSY